LRILPSVTLLVTGLWLGILWPIPLYLVVLIICAVLHKNRQDEHLQRNPLAIVSSVTLGVISLATQNPIWFQLELTFRPVVLIAVALLGRSSMEEIRFPVDASLVGETPLRVLKVYFYMGLVLIPIVNLLFAVRAPMNGWLLFRTLVHPIWLIGMSVTATWLAAQKAEREAR